MPDIERKLSNFIYNLSYESLPPSVVETTKRYIADYYAAAFAGIKVNEGFNTAVRELMEEMGGKEEADALLFHKRLPVANAAFLSACFAHGADMDDGNRKAMGHVGAHVISAALSLCQVLDVNGKDVIVAINAGYEIYNRVAAAVQPGLVHRGFHSTGTAGAIACGAVAAKLMKMDEEGIYNAMALSAVQASGLIIIAESGQSCKPINPANAARTGIISAMLVSKGVRSSENFLRSKKGFFHAMSDKVDEKMITEGLGESFTVEESYMKPYPSCRHTHCGIECALKLRESVGDISFIDKIKVYIYRNAIDIAGQIRVPKSSDDCKFSVHYSLAAALKRGHFNLSDLDVSTIDEELIGLIDKIELIEDPSMEKRDEGIRGSRVQIICKNGETKELTVLIPLGDSANPLMWDALSEKLLSCSDGLISCKERETLLSCIHNLDKLNKIKSINLYK